MNIYIINTNEHLGPYTVEDIFSLHRSRQINDKSLLWIKENNRKLSFHEFESILKEKKRTKDSANITPPEIPREVILTKRKESRDFKKIGLFVGLLGIVSFFLLRAQNLTRPEYMSLKTFKEALEFTKGRGEEADFRIYIHRDRNSFWFLGRNMPEEEVVTLKFKSESQKILSDKEISFSAQIKIFNDKFLYLDQLNFEKGQSFREGIYKVTIFSEGFIKTKSVLISNQKEDAFLGTLFDFHKKRGHNQSEFIAELDQKYQTLSALTGELIMRIESNEISSLNVFKNEYEKKYGPIFTSFVISNENDFKLLLKKRYSNIDKVFDKYFELSNIAREFGAMSFEAIENKTFDLSFTDKLESYQKSIEEHRLKLH